MKPIRLAALAVLSLTLAAASHAATLVEAANAPSVGRGATMVQTVAASPAKLAAGPVVRDADDWDQPVVVGHGDPLAWIAAGLVAVGFLMRHRAGRD